MGKCQLRNAQKLQCLKTDSSIQSSGKGFSSGYELRAACLTIPVQLNTLQTGKLDIREKQSVSYCAQCVRLFCKLRLFHRATLKTFSRSHVDSCSQFQEKCSHFILLNVLSNQNDLSLNSLFKALLLSVITRKEITSTVCPIC